MSAEQLRATVEAAIRANPDITALVAMMPLTAEAREAIWGVLAVAYSAGAIAGIDEYERRRAIARGRGGK